MAMTKAETARVAQLEQDITLLKAMKWPDYGRPASMTRADIEANLVDGGTRYGATQKVARGWFASSYDRGSVSYGCSNGVSCNGSGDITSTQGMGRMFWTELHAWQAVRLEMTERFAATLARVDAEIERVSSSAISKQPKQGE